MLDCAARGISETAGMKIRACGVRGLVTATTMVLLSACVPTTTLPPVTPEASEPLPEAESLEAPETRPEAGGEVPELTLNLPQNLPQSSAEDCRCEISGERDLIFLERGYAALAGGEYIEAVQYFQRYQRLENSPASDWESGVAIAYVSLLPNSPFYDPEAARKALPKLDKLMKQSPQVDSTSRMLRESIDALLLLERQTSELEAGNETLREELAKREEALKRLRELTLGQRGPRQ